MAGSRTPEPAGLRSPWPRRPTRRLSGSGDDTRSPPRPAPLEDSMTDPRFHTRLAAADLAAIVKFERPCDRRACAEWHGSAIAAFKEAVARFPDREAVIGVDGRFTYAQLDDRSDRLAGLLAARGAGPECAVGVHLPRSADLVVAILAILKAGAVYVPFDPEQPAQRLARIACHPNLVTALTHSQLPWNASAAFDASVQEWVRVFRGDTVAILTDDMRRDAEGFAAFMVDNRLGEADMTPSHAQMLIEDLESVARSGQFLRLFIGGEAVPPALWATLERLIADGFIEAMNLYGPTEAAVNVTGTRLVPGMPPHLGRPLAR